MLYMHSSRSIILSIGEGKREISFIGDKIRNNAMTVAQPPTQTWPTTPPEPPMPTPTIEPKSTTYVVDSPQKPTDWDGTVVVTNATIRLDNIQFALSKSVLLPESYPESNKLAYLIQQRQTLEIRLEGHPDIIDDAKQSLQLSIDRVIAVKRYLIGKGIAARRIQTKGYGDTRLITTEPLRNGKSIGASNLWC